MLCPSKMRFLLDEFLKNWFDAMGDTIKDSSFYENGEIDVSLFIIPLYIILSLILIFYAYEFYKELSYSSLWSIRSNFFLKCIFIIFLFCSFSIFTSLLKVYKFYSFDIELFSKI